MHTIKQIMESNYSVVSLNLLLEKLVDGTHHTPTYVQEGVKFISVTNITEHHIDFDDTKFISQEDHEKLIKRCNPEPRNILLTKIGSIGRAAVIPEDAPDFSIFVSVALLKVNKKVNSKYLCAYLNSNIAKVQFNRHLKGIGVPDLHLENIAQTQIILPDIDTQVQLAVKFELKLEERNEKLRQADDLLSGIESYLLDQLDLSFDNSEHVLCYAHKYAAIRTRIDADFYSPRFTHFREQIENSKYTPVTVGDICESMVSGFAAGKQDQADELPDDKRVPHLRPFSITKYGELSFETQKYVPISRLKASNYCAPGEILFNNTNSPELVGKSTVFDTEIPCACSNHITRLALKDGVNPYYVAAFFNVLLNIGFWKLLCTNFNNQAGINIDTLKAVKIPLPNIEIQNSIANEILRRKRRATELKTEAERDWQAARVQFETELLGE